VVPANQRISSALGFNIVQQATAAITAGDCPRAVTIATEALPYAPVQAIQVLSKAKILMRSSDVLSWVKLNYYVTDFGNTQAAINSVSSGFRALDLDLVRANQFIAFQKDGTGTDLLTVIPLPQLPVIIVPITPTLRAILSGDKLAALRSAAGDFAAADPAYLNAAAGAVAMTLRNIDDNIVRANGFADAQSKGQPYPITELH